MQKGEQGYAEAAKNLSFGDLEEADRTGHCQCVFWDTSCNSDSYFGNELRLLELPIDESDLSIFIKLRAP